MKDSQYTDAVRLKKSCMERIISGKETTAQAAMELSLTRRAVQYMLVRYRIKGDAALVNGHRGMHRKSPVYEALAEKITGIITSPSERNPFRRITYACGRDVLEEEHNIKCSDKFVKKVMNAAGMFSIRTRRGKDNDEEHLWRDRKEFFGELVQADGSEFDWFRDGHTECIQGFIDDATGIPVGLYMTKNECLLGYNEAFRSMALEHGIPEQMYPDRAPLFFSPKTDKDGRPFPTQFGRMMERFGVDMFPAYSPQAKGRIERFWQTLQQRLPVQFILHGIRTIAEANKFLHDVYIPKFIRKFARKAKQDKPKFIRASPEEINRFVRAEFFAATDGGGVFSFFGYRFFVPLAKTKIRICVTEKEGLWVERRDDRGGKRFEARLCETDTTGRMPDVYKDLMERVFLVNAKPRFREVYLCMEDLPQPDSVAAG